MHFYWTSLQVQSCHLGLSKIGVPKPSLWTSNGLVWGLLETRPHRRREGMGYSSESSSAIPHCLSYPPNLCPLLTFSLWKSCLPWNWSQVPKRLGNHCSKRSSSPKLLFGPMLLSFLNKFAIRINYYVCS